MSHSRRLGTGGTDTPLARTRRGFLQALLVSIGVLLVVGTIWLVSRGAPSAGRDPEFTPPAIVPTRSAPSAAPNAETG